MQAAVFTGSDTLEARQLPDPTMPDGGGLLAVEGCGVCIADAQTMRHLGGPPHEAPSVLGHEIVGRVVDAGPAAPDRLRSLVGRRVVVEDARPCAACEWCRRGWHRFCRAPHYGHVPLDGASGSWGGYAEQLSLDERSRLFVIPDDVPLDLATFVVPLASGFEWVCHLAALEPGERVAVVGASRMGLAAVAAAVLASASEVVLVHRDEQAVVVEGAGALGGVPRPAAEVDRDAFDVVVAVTESGEEDVALGVDLASALGRVVVASTSMSPVAIVPELVRQKGLMLRGGRGPVEESMRVAVRAVAEHRERLQGVPSRTFPLSDATAALRSFLDADGRTSGVHTVVATAAAVAATGVGAPQ